MESSSHSSQQALPWRRGFRSRAGTRTGVKTEPPLLSLSQASGGWTHTEWLMLKCRLCPWPAPGQPLAPLGLRFLICKEGMTPCVTDGAVGK